MRANRTRYLSRVISIGTMAIVVSAVGLITGCGAGQSRGSSSGLPSRTLTKRWEITKDFDYPLYTGDLVAVLRNSLLIVGSSGGGMMSAFDVRTGKEVWTVTPLSGWYLSEFFAFSTDSAYFYDDRNGYDGGYQFRAVNLGTGDTRLFFTSPTGPGMNMVGSTNFWSMFYSRFPQVTSSPGFTVLFDSGMTSWSGMPTVWPKYDPTRPLNWAAGRLVFSGDYLSGGYLSYFEGQNSTPLWQWRPTDSSQPVSAIVADPDALYLVGKDLSGGLAGLAPGKTRIFVKAFAATKRR